MVGTPNILFSLVAYHGRVLIKFNTYFPDVFLSGKRGTEN
nr:MAG TPA: Photosystem I reaction centre subunit IX / PsaJ [Caudoviricetes sp.]